MRQLLPHVPAGSRVFEIGAGIGCTVKSFELAGFDSSGIEPGRGFEQFGRDVLHARLECKQLEDLPLKPAYDFILLVHVIEHLASPSQALGRIRQMLRPGGRLYVECPNVEGPHAAPAKLFHYAHIYNFTHATLKMLAETTGFRVVACLTKPHHRTVRYVLERWDHSCPAPAMSAEAGARTVQAIHRYSSLTYYLRPSYLAERLWRDLRFSAHHFASRWRLARLIQRCQADATSLEKRVEMLSVASSVRS